MHLKFISFWVPHASCMISNYGGENMWLFFSRLFVGLFVVKAHKMYFIVAREYSRSFEAKFKHTKNEFVCIFFVNDMESNHKSYTIHIAVKDLLTICSA